MRRKIIYEKYDDDDDDDDNDKLDFTKMKMAEETEGLSHTLNINFSFA